MSYCRFSSDNWRSDVYVYDGDGIVINVAATRTAGDIPAMPCITETTDEEWLRLHRIQMAYLDTAERMPIESKYASKDYYGLSRCEAADLLEDMAKHGINVPDGVAEALREEAREEVANINFQKKDD